nr:ribonuclease H-like domain-containing protein [Tanacetum cinerariifolium]
ISVAWNSGTSVFVYAEVIVNDDLVSPVASASTGVEDEHLLKFHACKDAKSVWEAIKNRFGGNKESKKMQKTILKQNYENLLHQVKKDWIKPMIDNSSSTNETGNTAHSVSAASSKDQASTGSYADDVMTKVEYYNYHRRGHFIRECRAPRNQGNRNRDAPTRNPLVDTSTPNALVHQVQTLRYILALKSVLNHMKLFKNSMINDKTGLGYGGQMNESDLNDIHVNESEVLNNVFDSRESDGDDNQVNDRFKKGLDNSVFKFKVSETITSVPKIETNASKTTAVLTKSRQVPINAAKQRSHRAAASVIAAMRVNTAASRLNDQGIFDSECSRHMTGNKSYLTDYQKNDDGFVAFGGNAKGDKITRKGKIRTGKLNFEDVYFVKELKFNFFSVSQMCDKKNSVLFTDTKCVVLSPDFKLLDES